MKMRVQLLAACVVASLLVGCSSGGGDSSVPPEVPISNVNGAAVDALIKYGTISFYDFTNGIKGELLGSTVTDQDGLYNIELQAESLPILVEITEGRYVDESTGMSVGLDLSENESMSAVIYHVAGNDISVSITPYTNIATAYARYLIGQGSSVSSAIITANEKISQWVGFDIVQTIPLDISKSQNSSAVATDGHMYGFLTASISMWVRDHYPAGVSINNVMNYGCEVYELCSIDFIQSMYNDMLADGLLDGMGANAVPLSFGNTALDPNVYRAELAIAAIESTTAVASFTGQNINGTGLTSEHLLLDLRAYAMHTDDMFADVVPEPIDSPDINIVSHQNNTRVRGTINISGTVVDNIGNGSTVLLVDDVEVGNSATNYFLPSFQLNTNNLSDGSHKISFRVTNGALLIDTADITLIIDNTPPSFVGSVAYPSSQNRSYNNAYVPPSSIWLNNSGYKLATCHVSGSLSNAGYSESISHVTVFPVTYDDFYTDYTSYYSNDAPESTSLSSYQVPLLNNELSIDVYPGNTRIEFVDGVGNVGELTIGVMVETEVAQLGILGAYTTANYPNAYKIGRPENANPTPAIGADVWIVSCGNN